MRRENEVRRNDEEKQAECAVRAKLWQEYLGNYQRLLATDAVAFEAQSACFRQPCVLADAGLMSVR